VSDDVLLLPLGSFGAPVEEAQDGDALHDAGGRVAKESAPWLQGSVDSDMVLRGHVEVAGLGRVMRRLFGNVVGAGLVGQVPVARKDLAKDGVEWFLDASVWESPFGSARGVRNGAQAARMHEDMAGLTEVGCAIRSGRT
jgi:hypothetical protein